MSAAADRSRMPVYHGIEQMAEDTNIYIKGILDGDDCVIEITDAGEGMSEEEVEKLRLKIALEKLIPTEAPAMELV